MWVSMVVVNGGAVPVEQGWTSGRCPEPLNRSSTVAASSTPALGRPRDATDVHGTVGGWFYRVIHNIVPTCVRTYPNAYVRPLDALGTRRETGRAGTFRAKLAPWARDGPALGG